MAEFKLNWLLTQLLSYQGSQPKKNMHVTKKTSVILSTDYRHVWGLKNAHIGQGESAGGTWEQRENSC